MSASRSTPRAIAGAWFATASGPQSTALGLDDAHWVTLMSLGGTTNTPYLACTGSLYTRHPSGLASASSNGMPSL